MYSISLSLKTKDVLMQIYKCFVFAVAVNILCSCVGNNANRNYVADSLSVADDDVVVAEYEDVLSVVRDNKSDNVAIGDVCFGMNRQEVRDAWHKFRCENAVLGGITVDKMHDYYYDNKLIRLIVVSKGYRSGMYRTLEGGLYYADCWTTLYNEKYGNHAKEVTDLLASWGEGWNEGVKDLVIKRGNVRIVVADNVISNNLPKKIDFDNPEQFEREFLKERLGIKKDFHQGQNMYSIIDIVNDSVYSLLVDNARQRDEQQRKSQKEKNLKAI